MNDRVQNVKLQSIMEWQIPEPLSIRPCQKPSDLKARQLSLYPVKLRKLPNWVDNARFQPTVSKSEQQPQILINNQQNSVQNDHYYTLHSKYRSKHKYVLRYQRGQQKYQFNQNFAHQYIPANYCILDEHLQKQKKPRQQTIPQQQEDEVNNVQIDKKQINIEFDSKFECGNISKVYQCKFCQQMKQKIQASTILLCKMISIQQVIINGTLFLFVITKKIKSKYRLKLSILYDILSFQVKQKSLYKKGMKPWIINQGTKCWRQLQENCYYKKTNVRSQSGDLFYELEFNINLLQGLTYIAMLPIYSYSRLCENIEKWKETKGMTLYNKKVYSLVNNIVPILEYIPEITKTVSQSNKKNKQQNSSEGQQFDASEEQEQKFIQTVVIFGRIHPGEVWSSYLMQKVIDSVINYYKLIKIDENNRLRFLFFPMLNPDGVIYGNFRCDFSGVDLNRVWIEPSKFTECSIYQIKKILNKQFLSSKAAYFIDLHSHSKAYNIFAYTSAESIQQSRLLSDLIRLSDDNVIFDPFQHSFKLENDFIKESQCTFLSSKEIFLSKKKSTARAFMSRLTQKGRSMTVEISFHAYLNKKDEENPIRLFDLNDFKGLSECMLRKLHDVLLSSNEEFMKTKKSLMLLYTNYLAQLSRENHINLNSIKRQNRALSQQKEASEDSDSQPEKYYTTETKKLIKSKNGQLYDCRVIIHRDDKKSYMKQTQSMIHKTDPTKKEKINNPFERTKINSGKTNGKKDDIGKKTSISEYPIRAESQRKKKPSISQKDGETNPFLEANFSGTDRHNMFRKKIVIQSRNKEKKQTVQNKSQIISTNKDLMNNSAFDPMVLDLDDSKRYEPAFGQFLTKSKRSASRRYKTVTKQEFTIYQAQMARMRKNDIKQNFLKKDKPANALCTFLEDNMYVADLSYPKTQQHKINVSINESVPQNRQSRNSSRKLNQFNQPKLKRNGIQRANNFKNLYMFERKKIVEMMKKQTRFYNVLEKQSNNFGQVQQIVDKRKRAKTEFDSFKSYYEEKSIFNNSKMAKIKKQ